MQARERRFRHFQASVGLLLNENYGDGLIPNTVQSQDFLYMPASDIPRSGPALEFLQARLQEPHVHKPRSIGTSDSLYQAYRRAFCQPVGMVHYDRDPLYWKSKDRPGSEIGSFKSTSSSKFKDYNAMFNGYEKGPVPDVEGASTVKSVSTAKSSRTASTRPCSEMTGTNASTVNDVCSEAENAGGFTRSKIPSGRMEDNRYRLWTPGSEAAGFKPYSPFSDSLQNFGKKEAKYIVPEIKPEVDRTCDVLPAPQYKDALNEMLEPQFDNDTSSGNGKKNRADVLKLHGNPEYPVKVMDEKDVPNYVAWAKIYPYCPLTQIEGKERPQFVPPRGFTPSTSPSRTGSIPKLRDMKKEKRKIMEGIKLLSASSKTRRSGESRKRNQQRATEKPENAGEEIHPSLKALPPSLAAKLNPVLRKNGQDHRTNSIEVQGNSNTAVATSVDEDNQSNNKEKGVNFATKPSPQNSSATSVNYDPLATRKLLDMKMKAPTGWYGGQTPTHTPTPDPTLPIKATRAWMKHYSPARIRRFMRAVGGDMATPEPNTF